MRVVDLEPDSIIVEERQTRPTGDLDGLIASIQDVGLLHPIVVGTDHRLKVGYRRLMAFRQMGRDTIPAHLTDDLNDVLQALKAERDENTQREDLPPTVMVERARELEAQEREAAKERQGARTDLQPCGNFPPSDEGKTRDRVGDAFGVSGKTYEHARAVVEAAEAEPETFGDLPEQMDETSVHAAYQKMKQRKAEPRPHVTHNSGNNEWYTPPEYIEAARRVMGTIDLDPASSDKANEIVQARAYYTAETDGLAQEWAGGVWMNPPYSSDLIGAFTEKLVDHLQAGDVREVCVLVNNATETGWFQTLLQEAACLCLLRGRVKFIDKDGKPSGAPLQGQIILYAGPHDVRFAEEFQPFGAIFHAW